VSFTNTAFHFVASVQSLAAEGGAEQLEVQQTVAPHTAPTPSRVTEPQPKRSNHCSTQRATLATRSGRTLAKYATI
jgi:hypothetical protein